MTLFSFFELWGQGWYLWVTFGDRVSTTGCFLSLTSLPLGTAFMSKIISASLLSLQPHSSCSFSAQEKGLGVESQKDLLGSLGQSFPALWISTEWAATVIVRFYCFHFIFFQHHLLASSSKSTADLPVALLMACFPAELSSTVATCWKPLLVPEDVRLRQQQSHFLADSCSVPLKWFTSSWWCSSFCRFKAFLWPNSATLYCSSFEQVRRSCWWFNFWLLLNLLRVTLVTLP